MAAKHNIVIEQGATFPLNIKWQDSDQNPINLTGYRVRMQIRQTPESVTTLLSFDSNSLTTGQAIGALNATGVIDIALSAAITTALTFRLAEWDLTVTSAGGEVTRLVEGKASVSPGVTR